jgi:hypothetical protein
MFNILNFPTLSSFVNKKDYGLLLSYLIDIARNQLYKTTSVFIISGQCSSGKSTLSLLIRHICRQFQVNFSYLSSIDEIIEKKFQVNPLTLSPFNNDIVSGYDTNKIDRQTMKMLHQNMNHGFGVRSLFQNIKFLKFPGMLMLNVADNIDFDSDNYSRQIKQIHLPNRFYNIDTNLIIKKAVSEFNIILNLLTELSVWLNNYILIKYISYDIIGLDDLKYCFITSILDYSNIPTELLKYL